MQVTRSPQREIGLQRRETFADHLEMRARAVYDAGEPHTCVCVPELALNVVQDASSVP